MDYLNENSINYFQLKNNYFYSHNVKNEVEKIFRIKTRNYQDFLLKLLKVINNFSDYDLINEYDIHKEINSFECIGKLNNKEMHFALKIIWKNLSFDYYHDVFDVKLILDNFLNNFQTRHSYRKKELLKKLIIVPNHKIKDKIILDIIKKESLGKYLHDEDENILFDANEFCKNNLKLNLQFVSADQDFLKVIEILKDYLCIKEYINVMEFNT